jgi:hypothetical protein
MPAAYGTSVFSKNETGGRFFQGTRRIIAGPWKPLYYREAKKNPCFKKKESMGKTPIWNISFRQKKNSSQQDQRAISGFWPRLTGDSGCGMFICKIKKSSPHTIKWRIE